MQSFIKSSSNVGGIYISHLKTFKTFTNTPLIQTKHNSPSFAEKRNVSIITKTTLFDKFPVKSSKFNNVEVFIQKQTFCSKSTDPTSSITTPIFETMITRSERRARRALLREEGIEILHKVRERKKEDWEEEISGPGIWNKIKYGVLKMREMGWRFYYGAADLWNNTKEANLLSKRLKQGDSTLTRKEHRFIIQNRKDLRSLVPFFLVWRIPILGDFVLPIFIARFPGLLPSTFKLVKAPTIKEKIETAKIKQKSILNEIKKEPTALEEEQLSIIRKLTLKWENLESLSKEDIIEEEAELIKLTVDNLTKPHNAAICSRLQLGTRLPNYFLKNRLKTHISQIIKDDQLMDHEGVESLTFDEIDEATLERGLKVTDISIGHLENQLIEFVELSILKPNLIQPLLIYAHATKQRELILQPRPTDPNKLLIKE